MINIRKTQKTNLKRPGDSKVSKKLYVLCLISVCGLLSIYLMMQPPPQYGTLTVEVYVEGYPVESWGLGAAEVRLWHDGSLWRVQNTTNSKVLFENLPYGAYMVEVWWISQTNSTQISLDHEDMVLEVHLALPETGALLRAPFTPPIIHSFTLSEGKMNRTESCSITANITDAGESPLELDVDLRLFLPNGSLRIVAMEYNILEGLWQYNFTTTPTTLKGSWLLQVNVSDGTNQTVSEKQTLLIINNPPQIVSWTCPAEVIIPEVFVVNITVFDVEGIASVRINCSSQEYNLTTAPYSAIFETTTFDEGEYRVYITITDSDGEEVTESFTIRVRFPENAPSFLWLIFLMLILGVIGSAWFAIRIINRRFQKTITPPQKTLIQQTRRKIGERRNEIEKRRKLLEENG